MVRSKSLVFQKLLIYWDFSTQPFLGLKENSPVYLWENVLLMLIGLYTQGMQKTFSECTPH